MPPDTAERRPRAESGAHDDGDDVSTSVTDAAASSRRCDRCAGPLPPRRRRFCTDECRRKGQKAERIIEDTDYAAGVVRLIRSMGKRASADLEALQWLAGAVDHARDALALAVAGLRAAGYSWAEIGAALGITRQTAWERFGRQVHPDTGPAEPGAAG